MTGVPMLVPHGEPDVFEQVDAVDLRRKIRGARVNQQPDRNQHGGDPPGGERTRKNGRRPGSYRPGPRPTRRRCDGYVLIGTLESLGSSSRSQTLDNRHVQIMTSRPTAARIALRAALALTVLCATLAAGGCATGHPQPIAAGTLAEAETFPYFK